VSQSGLTLPPEAKASNTFLPSGTPTTGPSITNPFLPIPSYPATSVPEHCPTGLHPLPLIPWGDRAHVPFRLSELKK
jgi:hypothetical protein